MDRPRRQRVPRQSEGRVLPITESVKKSGVKRFVKKQQMQWTPRGAHLLLQTRTKVLNGDLEESFRRWYPAFRSKTEAKAA